VDLFTRIHFLETLSSIYHEVKIIVCQTCVVLPPVGYLLVLQWLPLNSHGIWYKPALELVFSLVKKPSFQTAFKIVDKLFSC
jgi:hypothetical protein